MNENASTPEASQSQNYCGDTPHPGCPEIERTVVDIVGIGRAWAVHGLTMGRRALELCAQSLGITARLLGDLAQRFDNKEPTRSTGSSS